MENGGRQLGSQMSALAFRSDDYRSPSVNGAAVFADTTANAKLLHHIGLPYVDTYPPVVIHLDLTELDSLVRGWTMFLAYDTGCS